MSDITEAMWNACGEAAKSIDTSNFHIHPDKRNACFYVDCNEYDYAENEAIRPQIYGTIDINADSVTYSVHLEHHANGDLTTCEEWSSDYCDPKFYIGSIISSIQLMSQKLIKLIEQYNEAGR